MLPAEPLWTICDVLLLSLTRQWGRNCRMGPAMNTRLIAGGALAGAVGGLVAFAFIRVCAQPIVGHAINLAGARMQPASAVDDHGVELFSQSMQATGELAFVVLSFGIAMGALLAAAFAITYVQIESVRPGALALLLASDAFAALSLVPSIKYRPALGAKRSSASAPVCIS